MSLLTTLFENLNSTNNMRNQKSEIIRVGEIGQIPAVWAYYKNHTAQKVLVAKIWMNIIKK